MPDDVRTLYCQVCGMAHRDHKRVPSAVSQLEGEVLNELIKVADPKVPSDMTYTAEQAVDRLTAPPDLWYCIDCKTVKHFPPDEKEGT